MNKALGNAKNLKEPKRASEKKKKKTRPEVRYHKISKFLVRIQDVDWTGHVTTLLTRKDKKQWVPLPCKVQLLAGTRDTVRLLAGNLAEV